MYNLTSAFQSARHPSRNYYRPAHLALKDARRNLAAYRDAAFLAEEASAILTEMWKAGGMKESIPGLREKRRASQEKADARAAAAGKVSGGKVWRKGEQNSPQKEKGHVFFPDPEDTFRGVWPAHKLARLDYTGYYDNPYNESFNDGSGLVVGYVAQLPSHGTRARYVAGYQYGSSDSGGMTFDLSCVFESELRGVDYEDAQKDAARAADSMAEKAAEEEREYQTAYEAGRQWAELKEEEETARAKALAILAERRAAEKAASVSDKGFFALCDLIRESVSDIWREIQESRAKRAELAQGECDSLYFYPDERLKGAFCEAAGIDGFPA